MRDATFQDCLPEGLVIKDALEAMGGFGHVFLVDDTRLVAESPRSRVVRILNSDASETTWRAPLIERLGQLTAVTMPYVSTPTDAGERHGFVYLVVDHYVQRLWDALPEQSGLEVKQADRWLRQVLTGLAELHRREIAHGDIRSKNVYLDHSNAREATAWLADAAIGPIAWWSNGESLHPDSPRHFPPEWKGKTADPSYRADLYAIGLMACEMCLGRQGNPSRSVATGEPAWQAAQRPLKKVGVPNSTTALIRSLLDEDPNRRPQDASDALRKWDVLKRREHRQRLTTWAAIIALVLLATGGVRACATANRLNELEQRLAEAENRRKDVLVEREKLVSQHEYQTQERVAQLREKEAQLAGLESEAKRRDKYVDSLRADLKRLGGTPPPEPGTAAVSPAVQDKWQDFVAGIAGDTPDKKMIQLLAAGTRVPDELKLLFRQVRSFYNQRAMAAWLRVDGALADAVRTYVSEPWNPAAHEAAQDRFQDLEKAKNLWKNWASPGSGMTWNNIKAQSGNREWKPQVRDILRHWCVNVETFPAQKWKIRFQQGAYPTGKSEIRRIVRLDCGGKQYKEHQWNSAQSHDYSTTPEVQFQFEWHPGDPIGLMLEVDDWVNTDIVRVHWDEKAFAGPVAVWYANHVGATSSKKGSLTFEIVNCPGPPPEVYAGKLRDIAKTLLPGD